MTLRLHSLAAPHSQGRQPVPNYIKRSTQYFSRTLNSYYIDTRRRQSILSVTASRVFVSQFLGEIDQDVSVLDLNII